MGYASKVNIRFTLQEIAACASGVESAYHQTSSMISSVDSEYERADGHITSMISWVDRCLEQTTNDYNNARQLEIWIRDLLWDKEKELESHKHYCDQLYQAKSEAYNRYDAVKCKQRSDAPETGKIAESIWATYRELEEKFKCAYQEREECERQLDVLRSEQVSLYDVTAKISSDESNLSEIRGEYVNASAMLNVAYKDFCNKTKHACAKLERLLEEVKNSFAKAKKVASAIAELNGGSVAATTRICFSDIAAVYRNAERMELTVEELAATEKRMSAELANYSALIRDNIMKQSGLILQDVEREFAKERKQKEQTAQTLKLLAKALQCYYVSFNMDY